MTLPWRIAIIDDERSVRSGLSNLLESEGYSTDTFDSAEVFLSHPLALSGAALVITDIKLRGMSGLELFDKLAHFDDFMHLLSGFVCAAFGFDFARIIQRKKGPCAVTLAAIFGLMFAVTIAAGWEFYEFLMDTLHGTNLQLAKAGPETAMFDLAKYHGEYGYIGLVDTMTDMMMNVVGGIVGMIFMIVLRTKGNKKPAAKAKK